MFTLRVFKSKTTQNFDLSKSFEILYLDTKVAEKYIPIYTSDSLMLSSKTYYSENSIS